jgi:protein-disulfide isomerase
MTPDGRKKEFVMQRIAVAFLTLGLLVAPAAAADKSAFNDVQKEELNKLIRAYILTHPEIISEAIDALDAKTEKTKVDKRNAVISTRRQELFNPAEGTIIGNPKGDVTVVEFFDYNCGYCKAMFQAMKDLLKEDPRMRVVLKEYPILGPSSMTASRAALAARKQGKYQDMHLALLAHKGSLTDGSIMEIAAKTGLDVRKLENDMKDPAITDVIVKNHNLADELGIDGTPSLIIGDAFVPGAISKEKLVEHIAKARK